MSTIEDAVKDLFNHPQMPADQALDRHFAPTSRQRTNGAWDDRPTFLARVVEMREVVEHTTIIVLDELVDGDRSAERHVLDPLRRDGQRTVQEVHVFARRDPDGRFVQIQESTLALQGGESATSTHTMPRSQEQGENRGAQAVRRLLQVGQRAGIGAAEHVLAAWGVTSSPLRITPPGVRGRTACTTTTWGVSGMGTDRQLA